MGLAVYRADLARGGRQRIYGLVAFEVDLSIRRGWISSRVEIVGLVVGGGTDV
jgi:hypothetical protein